jgi:hypothetical protein
MIFVICAALTCDVQLILSWFNVVLCATFFVDDISGKYYYLAVKIWYSVSNTGLL